MQRLLIFGFGIVSYVVFLLTFLYLIAFVGNLQQTGLVEWAPWLEALVPYSVSYGRETGPLALAVAVNLGLVLLFGLQHSVMARSGFKSWLTRVVPTSVERSFYVLVASGLLILLFWQWRPIPETLWAAQTPTGQIFGWTVFGAGFAIVLLSTFLIDHFDLFGLRQIWAQLRGREADAPRFATPFLYRYVRHPLYLGFILAFWGGPYMSAGHALFAGAMTAYILVAVRFEERDLVRSIGQDYVRYRSQVPMLLPLPRRGAASVREDLSAKS